MIILTPQSHSNHCEHDTTCSQDIFLTQGLQPRLSVILNPRLEDGNTLLRLTDNSIEYCIKCIEKLVPLALHQLKLVCNLSCLETAPHSTT